MAAQESTTNESPPTPLRSRRLKVGYAYTDPEKNLPSRPVPHLRLAGRWLKDAGFSIGQHVKIEVNEGRLTIEPVAEIAAAALRVTRSAELDFQAAASICVEA